MEMSSSSAFWEKVLGIFSLLLKQNVPKCPKHYIKYFRVNCTLTSFDKKMLIFCLLQAKLIVACHWKDIESPHFKQ